MKDYGLKQLSILVITQKTKKELAGINNLLRDILVSIVCLIFELKPSPFILQDTIKVGC